MNHRRGRFGAAGRQDPALTLPAERITSDGAVPVEQHRCGRRPLSPPRLDVFRLDDGWCERCGHVTAHYMLARPQPVVCDECGELSEAGRFTSVCYECLGGSGSAFEALVGRLGGAGS